METAARYAAAIRAGLAFSGWTQEKLAKRMGMHPDTLGRKLRRPESLTLAELEAADEAIRWTAHMEEAKR